MNLVPHGVSAVAYGRTKQWALRKSVYGPRGCSEDAHARHVVGLNRINQSRPKATHCKRGHKFRPGSYRIHGSGRQCIACERVVDGQRRWRERQETRSAQRLAVLGRAMARWGRLTNQQPTSKYCQDRFIKALARWRKAKVA